MTNLLPAVLVGGPPHAGKSVLFYHLTQTLRERNIPHHAIRACPDGEGNWFHEGDPTLVSTVRLKLTGEWPAVFVERMSQDLEHRCLPFLVDMGGHPRASQMGLFRLCTHSILLLREDLPEYTELWESLVAECNLLPLARLISRQEGTSAITSASPLLEGILTGLDRHTLDAGKGALFDALVEQVVTLFNSYNLQNLTRIALEQAPTEIVLNLDEALQRLAPTSKRWEIAMLQPFLESLPAQIPLSIYGVGPGWLYAALAEHADPQSFYLFDPKIGWIQPAQVSVGKPQSSEMHIEAQADEKVTVLTITFPYDRLAYFQPDPLVFPAAPTEKGLIINGRVPNWLLTALVRFYKAAGAPWIAPFYVPSNHAVVVYSRSGTYRPGDLVPKPAF